MKLGTGFLLVTLALGASACSSVNETRFPSYDGVHFRVNAKAENRRGNRAPFLVHVDRAGRSLQGAFEAAHHASTRYCVENFGSSRFDWTNVQSDDQGRSILPIVKGDAIIQGVCKA